MIRFFLVSVLFSSFAFANNQARSSASRELYSCTSYAYFMKYDDIEKIDRKTAKLGYLNGKEIGFQGFTHEHNGDKVHTAALIRLAIDPLDHLENTFAGYYLLSKRFESGNFDVDEYTSFQAIESNLPKNFSLPFNEPIQLDNHRYIKLKLYCHKER